MEEDFLEIEAVISREKLIAATDLAKMLSLGLSQKQLKYRLNQLRKKGRISTEGKARWLKYKIAEKKAVPFYDLLENFVPNVYQYFTDEEKEELWAMGATENQLQAGTYERDIHERILIDLSWASSKLEGSTYTLLDTQHLIETSQKVNGSNHRDAQMILNHKRAIEFILEGHGLSEIVVRNLQATLVDGLIRNPRDGGRLRKCRVSIHGSVFVPVQNPHRIVEQFTKIIMIANQIEDAFERSFFLLVQLPYLQAFTDGNKRTARLSCNIPLMEKHLKPLTFINVSREEYAEVTIHHYETRDWEPLKQMYMRAYSASVDRFTEIERRSVQPNLFRMKHRKLLYSTVALLVRSLEVEYDIDSIIAHLDLAERKEFLIILDEELENLHVGNFMRYQISPNAFQRWEEKSG